MLYLGLAALAGCGSGGTLVPQPVPDASPLRGNWLVVGSMPKFSIGPKPLGLALTIDVVSGQIIGNASILIPCSGTPLSSAVGGGTKLEPTSISRDGTFTLEDVLLGQETTHQFVLHGTLAKTAGEAWSGTYDIATSSLNSGCQSYSGTFSAARFQAISGSYAAAGKLNGSSQTLKILLNLEQGGPDNLNVFAGTVTGENAIGGTIQIQGSPCFANGTIQQNRGALFGNYLQLEFTMDDGSTVSISGWVNDLVSSSFTANGFLVAGGSCDKMNGLFGAVFTRQ